MKKNLIILIAIILTSSFSGCYLIKTSQSYYGVDTGNSKRMVFLIDISGSMEGKAETDVNGNIIASTTNYVGTKVANKVGGLAGKVIANQTSNQLTKLGKAKKELIPTIRGLSDDCYFTIFIFENRVTRWRKSLLQATTANKNLAIAYINKLHSGGGTNIYSSLEKAFELSVKNDETSKLETIYLLSDGSPTAGKVTNPTGILSAVQSWNTNKAVTIHTIGLGEDCDKEFMKKLADENNGQFIDK